MRRAAALILVAAVGVAAGIGVLATFRDDRDLSVGTIRVSVDPGHAGALDLFVPLVNWGVRFDAVRLPARLSIDVRTINRKAVARIAGGAEVDVERLRAEARDEIAGYLRELVVAVFLVALAAGALTAFVLRGRAPPRLRWTAATAAGTALALAAAVALLLPPRGTLDNPEYYANGPEIPRALQAVETAALSARTLSEELNDQLVGLARLVSAPGQRGAVGDLPRLTLASDLHNNVLALPALERAASGGPLFFAGDLTDRGAPLEVRLVRRVVDVGTRFVFVSGNHDSDVLLRRLAREGAIVLTTEGRLRADGSVGERVVRVAGLRVAGFSDPFERRRAERFRAREEPQPTLAQQRVFDEWLQGLLGSVDVVMVHAPQLAALALERLREDPPDEPLVLLMGHTHDAELETFENVVVLNGGTAGGGGTGNLDEKQPIGVALLTYDPSPGFRPLVADLAEIDPGDGSATAQRHRLDVESAQARR